MLPGNNEHLGRLNSLNMFGGGGASDHTFIVTDKVTLTGKIISLFFAVIVYIVPENTFTDKSELLTNVILMKKKISFFKNNFLE
jgi:hypothetical protein